MKNQLRQLKNFNMVIQVLILILVVLILLNIALSSDKVTNQITKNESGPDEETDRIINGGVSKNRESFASPIVFDTATEKFLRRLPVRTDDFYIDNFPLEDGAKPKVVVTLLTQDARNIFELWLSGFSDQPDVEFFFDTSVQFTEGEHGI